MKIKLTALALALLLLAGCGLAQPDAGGDNTEDKLAGVCVTFEYVDLFDLEGYLSENYSSGGEIKGDTGAYEGRIYASERPGADGLPEYYFEGVAGLCFIVAKCGEGDNAAVWLQNDGAGRVSASLTELTDEGRAFYSFGGEDSESAAVAGLDMSVTLYTTGGRTSVYANPIYRDSAGRLYLVSGEGITGDIGTGSLSQTLTQEAKDLEKTIERSRVEVTVQGIDPPLETQITYMSAASTPISEQTLNPKALPNTLTPPPTTAYAIITTQTNTQTTRTLLTKETPALTMLTPAKSPMWQEVAIPIAWDEVGG